jgi:multidrug efflux system membrane fusion protein
MKSRSRFLHAGLFLSWAALLTGCNHQQATEQKPELPVVPVSQPVQRQVTEYVYYTGRMAAVNSVDIRPRVTGYLTKMPFKEGTEVKAGELLFEIDPRPYQALVDQAEAQVNLNTARLRLASANNKRARTVAAREPGAFSQQELDTYQAQEIEADAAVKAARATLAAYKLNRSFCEVTSPIDGQVSRYYYTIGNLVNQDQTPLTTIVSLDPMYAYFDADERTMLRIRKGILEGTIQVASSLNEIRVDMALEGETDYSHHGHLNFINNQVNPNTGTITLRADYRNPVVSKARRLLAPGLFVRIRVPVGQPHDALLVADRAIGSDQGLKFVYVVDQDNKVQYRRVTPGTLEEDALRVVKGIDADDWVVVGALQQVRPLMQVEPEHTEMPTIGGGQAPPPVPRRPQPPPAREKNTDSAKGLNK